MHLVPVQRCEQTCLLFRNLHLLLGSEEAWSRFRGVTLTCTCSRSDQESLLRSLRPPTSNRGNVGFLEASGGSGLGSGERDLPSLCVGAQFTGADDQHARRVHPVQSHLRVQAEAGDQVLQVGPRFLPTLEVKRRSHQQFMQTAERPTLVDFKAAI